MGKSSEYSSRLRSLFHHFLISWLRLNLRSAIFRLGRRTGVLKLGRLGWIINPFDQYKHGLRPTIRPQFNFQSLNFFSSEMKLTYRTGSRGPDQIT